MSRSFVGARAPWLRCRERRAHPWFVFACILLLQSRGGTANERASPIPQTLSYEAARR